MNRAPFTLDGPYRKRSLWDRIAIPALALGVVLVVTAGLVLCIN